HKPARNPAAQQSLRRRVCYSSEARGGTLKLPHAVLPIVRGARQCVGTVVPLRPSRTTAIAVPTSGRSTAADTSRTGGDHEKGDSSMKKRKSGAKEGKGGEAPSQLIHARSKELGDWRGETLARVRTLIREADPDVVEEVKWRKPSNSMRGVPVWEHDGIICIGETYKAVVKLTFAKGASLKDPSGLFNSSLEGNTRRAIDIHEGDKIDEKALKAIILAAVALNTSARATARPVRSQN